jgi:hypothetical protein
MTGMRSCSSAIPAFGPQVRIVQLGISSTLAGDVQVDQRPAITISPLSAIAIA